MNIKFPGWIKNYADKSRILGFDYTKTSWRNTPNEEIESALIFDSSFEAKIIGNGNFWYSEEYQSKFLGPTELVSRTLKRQLQKNEFVSMIEKDKYLQFTFGKEQEINSIQFPIEYTDKWLNITINRIDSTIDWYITNEK